MWMVALGHAVKGDRRRWEERYRGGEYDGPDGPTWLLEAYEDALPAGRALDVACGTGRNARFLARGGWTVDAVDVSREALTRGRDRDAGVNWVQADLDSYCLPTAVYDVVNVTFFDARDGFPSLKGALASGGILCYHHHLLSPDAEGGPSDRYRFAWNELLELCADVTVLHYEERRADDGPHVTLVARNSAGDEQRYPER